MSSNALFLLSFRQRDELAAVAEAAGWSPIAARRAANAERRFILSGASIAVVDARGAFEEGLAAIAALADPVEANAAALLALVSRTEIERIDEVLAAGATHYLASPFGDQELVQALRFAERYAVRLGGSFLHEEARPSLATGPAWRIAAEGATVELSAAFATQLGLARSVSRDDFFAALGERGAQEAAGAFARIEATRRPTAFAHPLPGGAGERLVHHLSIEGTGAIVARVEQPDRSAEPRSVGRRDFLTGLGDARAAREWIAERLAVEEEEGAPKLSLLLLALQRFDMINAGYGAATGDAVLQGMARRIERLVGARAGRKRLIARLAGAEFVVGLSPPTSLDEAEFLARQLVDAIGQPFVTGDQVIRLKVRCGIVTGGEDDGDPAAVLRRASAALAEARDGDGSAIRLFGAREEDAAARASRLEIDLRPALDQDDIAILFQPQVAVTSGAIVGVEALARWRHPTYGELGAASLFAAAERADHLIELSRHVQSKAVRETRDWPAPLQTLRLAINVTSAEMAQPDFTERFCTMIDEAGFERGRLTVEVTESGLIEDLGAAAERLAELRAGGFRVAIDDFGTGYSSLAYLKSLPLDYLKIDRRLSQDITGSARDRVIVRGVIEMARSLGLTVIAEGVETEEQLAALAEEGCALYQGFLCSPPVASDELARLLARRG